MNGTFVHYYDIFNTSLGIQPGDRMPYRRLDPAHPMDRTYYMYFEAAWRPGSDEQAAALCLTKKRWSTIPVGSPCVNPALLQDPRQKGSGGRFCDEDDGDEQGLEMAGAYLFNDSAFIDLGLFHWVNATDNYTNSSYVDFYGRPELTSAPLFFSTPALFEGAVFNHDTSWGPLSQIIELRSYYNAGTDAYLTTTYLFTPPPGFTHIALEGKVYDPTNPPLVLPPNAQQLNLFRDQATGQRFITSTQTTIPPGFDFVDRIGILPR